MTRVALVSNPASGSTDDDTLEQVAFELSPLGDVVQVRPESPDTYGDALRAALGEGRGVVVVAGGDGTINDALNGLGSDLRELVFGIVPMGTGNDLAGALGIAEDPIAAARQAAAGRETALDLCRAYTETTSRLFVNACMGGFPVLVNREIDGSLKERLGPLAFWVGGVKAAADLERWRVRVDGELIEDAVAVGVGNGKRVGGGMEVFPDARLADGLIDLCIMPAAGVAAGLRLAASVARGDRPRVEGVVTRRARRFEIGAEPELEFNCDGELIDLKAPATFEVTGRICVRVPAA